MIEEGRPAPDFELESDAGETVKLSDFRGRPVVLYFYPKDDTPGCTTEACEFRDAYDVFRERGAEVLGVSPDDVASHDKFKSKYELPFTLLADPHFRIPTIQKNVADILGPQITLPPIVEVFLEPSDQTRHGILR